MFLIFIIVFVFLCLFVNVIDGQCDNVKLKTITKDPTKQGPWQVGCSIATVGNYSSFLYYPSSGKDGTHYNWDLRDDLPDWMVDKIDISKIPSQDSSCTLNLAYDTKYGPYPLIISLHKDGSVPHESSIHLAHLASRGFVVIQPRIDSTWMKKRIYLNESVSPAIDRTIVANDYANAVIEIIKNIQSQFDNIDITKIGIIGQGYGGSDALPLLTESFFTSNGITENRPSVFIAVGGTTAIPASGFDFIQSILYLGGYYDNVVSYTVQKTAYTDSFVPSVIGKRLIVATGSGHHIADMWCSYRDAETPPGFFLGTLTSGGIDYSQTYGTPNQWGTDGCIFNPDLTSNSKILPQETVGALPNYVFASVMEETLHCNKKGSSNMYHISNLKGIPLTENLAEGNAKTLGKGSGGGGGGSSFPWWGIFIIIIVILAFFYLLYKIFQKKKGGSGHV